MPPLFVLRHGETEWNREGRCQGHLDAPLTDLGRAQAAQQGRILHDQVLVHTPHVAIHVSPLGRSRATWDIAAAAAGLAGREIKIDPSLAEVHMGAWQGRLRAEFLAEDPSARAHSTLFEMSLNAPGGEDFDALKRRLDAFLHKVEGPTICVTHGITSQLLRGVVCGLSRADMAALDHEQGVIYALIDGQEHRLVP